MKMYLISDNIDTLTGMRLAGVEGVIVNGAKEVKEAIENVFTKKDVGILLITEKLSEMIPDYINDIKLNRTTPLLVVIPDRHGSGRKKDFITSYIKEAIGVKL